MEVYALKEVFAKEDIKRFKDAAVKAGMLDPENNQPTEGWQAHVGTFLDGTVRYSNFFIEKAIKGTDITRQEQATFQSLSYYIGPDNQDAFRKVLKDRGVLQTGGGIGDSFKDWAKKRGWYYVFLPKLIVWVFSEEPHLLDIYPSAAPLVNAIREAEGKPPLPFKKPAKPIDDLELR